MKFANKQIHGKKLQKHGFPQGKGITEARHKKEFYKHY